MAETIKKSFPMLPVAHWFALRKKFKQSIPGVITDNYLATVLDMAANSARANVLPFLRTLGIIDTDGKPKERAKLWRDDNSYPEVCQAILKEVYPDELLHAVPDPQENRDSTKRWFANQTGSGDAACSRMAALYTILIDANPSPKSGASKQKPAQKHPKEMTKPPQPKIARKKEPQKSTTIDPSITTHDGEPRIPSININLQVHISADASSDQIEQIFAAMAKHIYKRQ
jgi:hypothetical protein